MFRALADIYARLQSLYTTKPRMNLNSSVFLEFSFYDLIRYRMAR